MSEKKRTKNNDTGICSAPQLLEKVVHICNTYNPNTKEAKVAGSPV